MKTRSAKQHRGIGQHLSCSRFSFFETLIATALLLLAPTLGAHADDSGATCGGQPLSVAAPTPDADLRTPPRTDGPTEMRAGMFVEDLREIDAVASSYRFRGVITVSWCDPRLAFDADAEGVAEKVLFGPAAESHFENAFTARGFPVNQVGDLRITERVLRIRHDGMVSADLNVSVQLVANYDLRRFPFDTQELTLVIESFVWDSNQVVFVPDASATGFADDFDIPEWTITGVRASVDEVDVVRSSKPFSRITLTIDVQRKSGFYLWKVLLPLFIIVALSWSIFWMVDEKFGIRVRTSATGILTVVAYQFVAGQNLPRVGYLTLIDKIMVVSFLLLAITVFESYLVSRYQPDDRDRAEMIDRAARLLFPLGYATAIAVIFFGTPG